MKRDGTKPRERRRGWYYRLSFPKKTALWGVIFLLPWLLGLTGIAAAHLATDIGAAVLSMIVFAVHYRRMILFADKKIQ